MSSDEVLILANPAAGRGRGLARARQLAAELERRGRAARLHVTSGAEDVEATARAAAAAGLKVLAVAGGDGTLRRAAQGLHGGPTALAVLPAGRGNDLVRALGLPERPAALAELVVRGATRAIDLGRCGAFAFLTVAAFGFDARVSAIVYRREVPFRGTLSYLLATLKALGELAPVEVALSGDFGRLEGPVLMVSSANTRSYGGGMAIAPGASCQDGLLDVCVVRPVSAWKLLTLLPRVFRGGHLREREVSLLRTRALRLETARPMPLFADGEPMGETPATIEALPGALRVVAL